MKKETDSKSTKKKAPAKSEKPTQKKTSSKEGSSPVSEKKTAPQEKHVLVLSNDPSTVKYKIDHAFEALKDQLSETNKFALPKILKVVISVGTGSGMKKDRNRNEHVIDRLARITGQKPSIRGAKKAIASFKTRVDDPIGVMVTLRGIRMYTFLDKLVHIALPRTKDFRGLNRSTVNDQGNMTIGIREHTIFPETSDEDIRDVFGMAITIVTTAKTRERGLMFFEYLGFPLKKEESKKK